MDHLFGKWSEQECKRIEKTIHMERIIDKELWLWSICWSIPTSIPALCAEIRQSLPFSSRLMKLESALSVLVNFFPASKQAARNGNYRDIDKLYKVFRITTKIQFLIQQERNEWFYSEVVHCLNELGIVSKKQLHFPAAIWFWYLWQIWEHS